MANSSNDSPYDIRVLLAALIAAAIAVSIGIGILVGSEEALLLAGIFGFMLALAINLTLRERIWILIPAFWYVTGRIGALPLPFSVRDLAILLAAGMFVLLFAIRAIRGNTKTEFLDVMVFVNFAYLMTVFFRNPAGLNSLGSSTVGGRPYFDAAIGLVAFVVLTRVHLTPRLAKILPLLVAIPPITTSLLGALTHFVPSSAPFVSRLYSDIDVSEYLLQQAGMDTSGPSRVTSLLSGARVGLLSLLSYFEPLSLLLPIHWFRFGCFFAVCIGIALSGFRNAILFLAFAFVVATWLRRGLGKAILVSIVGVILAFGLVTIHNFGFSLPVPAQRALSFLPGDWDADAKADAEDSADWRFYMWDMVLHTDTYIHNKLLGDGFGFSSYELQIMENAQLGETGFVDGSRQESFLIQGAFHSGPLSAVRYVGAVGLSLYLLLLVTSACYAWKLIRRCSNSDFFPVALMVGIPVIYEPIQYVLVFGQFDSGFPNTLFLCGMLKLISKSFASNDIRKPIAGLHTPSPVTLSST
ncbi:MAG: O-antigen ligase family protein [Verrucomicrobia bacterium]|nr:O-antigen ligase family protein [Verrucomicrobiota bacterium]